MLELNRLLQGMSQSGMTSGLVGGLVGGAATAAFTGKSGRKAAKTLLKVGGIAAAGGLAYRAYQAYRRRDDVTPAWAAARQGTRRGQWHSLAEGRLKAVAHDAGTRQDRHLIVSAMVSAALADGQLDNNERERIFQQLDELGLSQHAGSMVLDELRNPLSLEALTDRVTDDEGALEVYAASALVIDGASVEGSHYLSRLAQALAIPEQLLVEVHRHTNYREAAMVAA